MCSAPPDERIKVARDDRSIPKWRNCIYGVLVGLHGTMAFDDVMRLAQQRGFFFKTADSYPNSPAGFWDYGPLGVAMRNRFVGLWRRSMLKRDGMIEIDGAQILPRAVFEASGHLSGFTDPFVKCSKCGSVFRPDKLIEEKTGRQIPEKLPLTEYDTLMDKEEIRCQKCGSALPRKRRT
jgi:glycyl-tRNA synthetase